MTEMDFDDIHWPALRFGAPDCSVLKYDSSEVFIYASTKKLARWKNMEYYFLVDSKGTRYCLESPEYASPPSLLAKLMGRKSRVRWRVGIIDTITVAELRRLVLADIEKYQSLWLARDIETIEKSLDRAQTIEDIMQMLG
ncbi:MAG: hypothetical protein KF886_23450 [Candidatus Hydrogenedentes bacterium]|nr:hypothetical protein [Candidatus Hydrogenedentota bacterium]